MTETTSERKSLRAKHLYRIIDERCGAEELPLLAVSIHKGVVRRDTMTDDEARADDLSSYKRCAKDDIVVNRMRAFQGAIGIAPQAGIVSPDYLVLRIVEGEPRFFHHLFRSTWFVGEMTSRLRGIGGSDQGNVRTPRINAEELGEIRLSLPSPPEQKVVANFLDTETARIDGLIETKRQVLTLLNERLRERAWFLTLGGAVGAEPRLTSVPRDRWWWSHEVPAGWQVKRLADVVRATNGFPFDSSAFNVEGRGTRLIRIRDLASGATPTYVDAEVPPQVLISSGDVVVGMDGDFNVVRWGGPVAALNQRLCRLAPTHGLLDPAYLAYVLPMPLRYINDLTFFTTVKHLSTGDLLAQRIPVPPRAVQAEIVRVLDSVAGYIHSVGSRLGKQIDLLREHREALITAAVTGQLDVAKAVA